MMGEQLLSLSTHRRSFKILHRKTCPFLDRQGRIEMVHVVPSNHHMQVINTELASVMDEAKNGMTFTKGNRRGAFKTANVGISMGGGRMVNPAISVPPITNLFSSILVISPRSKKM
jgi:hypothetical protein